MITQMTFVRQLPIYNFVNSHGQRIKRTNANGLILLLFITEDESTNLSNYTFLVDIIIQSDRDSATYVYDIVHEIHLEIYIESKNITIYV